MKRDEGARMPVTKKDLKKLPLRAIVAFAARCARRVRTLFPDDKYPTERISLDPAIDIAESVARGIKVSEKVVKDSITAAYRAEAAADRADTRTEAVAYSVAYAAAYAAVAAAKAARSELNIAVRFDAADVVANAASHAAAASANAIRGATATADANDKAVAYCIQDAEVDYRRLVALGLGKYPRLGHPIDPAPSGPLGPLSPDREREPDDVRLVADPTRISSVEPSGDLTEPALIVYIDPGDSPKELIAELYVALSALYRSHGGSGLRIALDEPPLTSRSVDPELASPAKNSDNPSRRASIDVRRPV
jgi:hypothetical protein